jgi:hypothetical protein
MKSEQKLSRETSQTIQTSTNITANDILNDEEYISASNGEESEQTSRKQVKKSDIQSNETSIIEASYLKFQILLSKLQIVLVKNFDELDFINDKRLNRSSFDYESLYDKYYILMPLDMNFNIHQCVYRDDINLPTWKLFGTLPIIEFTLTDLKLEQIVELALSIPLPKSDRVNNDDDLLETQTLDDLLYSNEIKLLENLTDINEDKNRETIPTSASNYLSGDNFHQATDLELAFEIKEINFRLKECKAEFFDFIQFKIKSFGIFLQAKTYDNEMHVYLNKMECIYGLFNDVNNEKLYLLNTLNDLITSSSQSSKNLIDIRITQTDPDSPTLTLIHNNKLINVDLKLTLIDVVFNLHAVKSLLQFSTKFEHNINKIKYQKYDADIKKFQDKQKKTTNAAINSISSNELLLNDTKIENLVFSSNGENEVKISKRNNNFMIDPDIIEFKLNAKFDGLRVRLSTLNKNYFQVNINTLEAECISKSAEKNIKLVLNSINIIDMDENVSYHKLLSLKENEKDLITVQIKLFNAPKTKLTQNSLLAAQYQREKFYFRNYLNKEYFDIAVNANISKLKFVFLFKNINTFLVSLI